MRRKLLLSGLALVLMAGAASSAMTRRGTAVALASWTDDPACGEACSFYCHAGGYPNFLLCMDVCKYCHCGFGPSPCSGV